MPCAVCGAAHTPIIERTYRLPADISVFTCGLNLVRTRFLCDHCANTDSKTVTTTAPISEQSAKAIMPRYCNAP